MYFFSFSCNNAQQGSNTTPFDKACNANYPENWDIKFIRKLVREVKTISKAVVVVSAGAIGGELVIEAEPMDHTIFSSVSYKLLIIACIWN